MRFYSANETTKITNEDIMTLQNNLHKKLGLADQEEWHHAKDLCKVKLNENNTITITFVTDRLRGGGDQTWGITFPEGVVPQVSDVQKGTPTTFNKDGYSYIIISSGDNVKLEKDFNGIPRLSTNQIMVEVTDAYHAYPKAVSPHPDWTEKRTDEYYPGKTQAELEYGISVPEKSDLKIVFSDFSK